MKKLLMTTAALCLTATTAFAAPVAVKPPTPKPRVVEGTGGAKITGRQGVITSGSRVNMGSTQSTTKVQGNNVLDQAVSVALGSKLSADKCDGDSIVSLLNSAQFSSIARGSQLGLVGSICFNKFKGSDITIANRVQRMADGAVREFEGMMKSGDIVDKNGDKVINVDDATDAQKGRVIALGQAAVLVNDKVAATRGEAVDKIEATVENACDVTSARLGTAGAFQAARAL